MQNFMKTIINAVQAWTKKEISKIPAVEPDWNENDPNKDSYIKNKPTNLATKQDVLDLANATKEYVDSVSVSFEVEQNLKEEQKKIARKNICLYDWKTFRDEWGKYVYATNHHQSSLKYEIAQTIVNVTGNGSVSALEDIVSLADGLELYTQNPSETSFEQVQGIVKNYKALDNGGAVGTSLYFYTTKDLDLRDPNAVYTTIGVFKPPRQTAANYYASHWIMCECDDIIAKYYYDEETDSMLHVDFRYKCVDKELEKLGFAADAKAVGDALAEKQPKGNYLTSYTETDPTVPAWAKASKKPSYTASEVGADASGTAESLVTAHNTATDAHVDIRERINQLSEKKANKDEIPSLTGYATQSYVGQQLEGVVQQVITALGTPVFGRVDADNNIILTGELAEGTYILKYEDAEGNVAEVGTISTIETSGEIPVTLTMGKIDSSTGAISTSNNMLYSQAIPVESGKKYRLVANGICGGFKIAYYDSTDKFISCTSSNLAASESGQLINVDVEVPIISSASYFRLRVSALWYNGGYTEAITLLRNNVHLLWELV